MDFRRAEALGYRGHRKPDWYPSWLPASSKKLVKLIDENPFGSEKKEYIKLARKIVRNTRKFFDDNQLYPMGWRIKCLNSWYDKNTGDIKLKRLYVWAELYGFLLQHYVRSLFDTNIVGVFADIHIITRELDNLHSKSLLVEKDLFEEDKTNNETLLKERRRKRNIYMRKLRERKQQGA